MITRVRLHPPRVDRIESVIIDGDPMHASNRGDYFLRLRWFGWENSGGSIVHDGVVNLTPVAAKQFQAGKRMGVAFPVQMFLARYQDQMNTVLLTQVCSDVRRRVCEFL